MSPSTALKGMSLHANVRARRLLASEPEQWSGMAASMEAGGAVLISLWGADERERDGRFRILAAYLLPEELVVVEHALAEGVVRYPDLSGLYPIAGRLQRATADLLGIHADGGDPRGWLRHGGWPETFFPLRRDSASTERFEARSAPYPFVSVTGEGVHEIPVGPVHAGTIEPGNFRFSVVGEKVLRLEERLGYTHKGIAKRFTELAPLEAYRLAGRVSGDSTVTYAWAYCMALESAAEAAIPPRAQWLRALLLERERVAAHLGDLGALGNDAALTFGLAQFSRLREDWLRVSKEVFGHRLMMDGIV